MELKGEIVDIIYKNEINSYTIANLETQDEVFTIVGYLPFVNIGESIKAEGKFVTHQEYGRQFKVEIFEKLMPETIDALERYLASGNIKGIGPSTANKIVKAFGENTISIFKFEPEKLAQIKGISSSKAIEIAQDFNSKFELWQLVSFLDKFKIPASAVEGIYKKIGENPIRKIEENPYILIEFVRGADFKQIDKVAINNGIDVTNEQRIQKGILYSLNIITLNGHTCVIKQNLIEFVKQLLNIPEELIENQIINLNSKQKIKVEKRENIDWIYLYEFYIAEVNISEKLVLLDNSNNIKYISKIEKQLKALEKKSDIILSEKQIEAVKQINNNNVCIITGGPGTGKTTIIKTVLEIYKEHGKKVVLCAPTGRAAKRMEEATGSEAKTLHRLLEIGKIKEEIEIEDVNYRPSPIDADVIIIDEMSMVDTILMNYLVQATYIGTKLILVGDVDQLQSVGPGSVLKNIIGSKRFATVYLDKIFRQAAQSKIILNAHNVNNGEGFIKTNNNEELKEDFFFLNSFSQEKMLQDILSLSNGRLQKFGEYDFFKNIQVITPTKKGNLGVQELNKKLQEVLNPKAELKKEKTFGSITFRQGDRIMQIKNNYDIYWERNNNGADYGNGIFNGEFGTIVDINEEQKQIKVLYEDKNVWYSYQDIEQIEHAYAITVHKSQGSEFDVVILAIPEAAPMLLTRNLLYTAITRAKKLLIVISNSNTIDRMLKNYDSKQRNTGLEYKLIKKEI